MTQPDMNAILQQAQQMQAQLQAAQQEIVASTIVGEVTDIAIDPKVVDPEDVDGLQDLVLAAFQDATAKVQSLAEQKMGPLSQGFDGLGGLGF